MWALTRHLGWRREDPAGGTFTGRRHLWCIICMSTRRRLEGKQRDSHRQQTAEICVSMPGKQQRKTLIYASRKAPDAHSDLHEKGGDTPREMQNTTASFLPLFSSFSRSLPHLSTWGWWGRLFYFRRFIDLFARCWIVWPSTLYSILRRNRFMNSHQTRAKTTSASSSSSHQKCLFIGRVCV